MFNSFAGYGSRQATSEMDGARFAKLCKDSKLLDKSLTPTDVDLIFSKIKTKGARKIGVSEFKSGLELVAQKKGQTVDEIVGKITAIGGPKTNATVADAVKFHDDKKLYTGVYKNGGPTNVDGAKDLSGITDRSPADRRGVKK